MSTQKAWKAWVEENPLRRWRKRTGTGIMQAAALIGVSMTTIQLWERGVNMPDEENSAKVAAVCGTKVVNEWSTWFDKRPAAA